MEATQNSAVENKRYNGLATNHGIGVETGSTTVCPLQVEVNDPFPAGLDTHGVALAAGTATDAA